MSKSNLDMPRHDDIESYELPTLHPESDSPSSPLLPSYSSSLTRSTSPPLTLGGGISKPKRSNQTQRSTSRACRALLILWALIVPTLLGGALVGCYTGHGKKVLDSIKEWDSVPQDIKDWINGVNVEKGSKHDSGMFPTDIGYAGPTPTGREPGLLAEAPHAPIQTSVNPLLPPTSHEAHHKSKPIQHLWGNLSPYHSVDHGLGDTSSLIPDGCTLTELHWLQRHGARYPTSSEGGPREFAKKLQVMNGWKASGELKFLEGWEWSLGAEVLTPFGREQLFDLGVAARVKYGFLLDKMEGRLPVFRTESQDRMLKSAQNFAAGFFGIPAEDQYNLEVTIEAPGFNNTLAPWNTCDRGNWNYTTVNAMLRDWDEIFLKDAKKRLQKDLQGLELTMEDVRRMMDVCPYETVALGYSPFCALFTEKEWKGYEYRWDMFWWYSSSFGYPNARAQGRGWGQELLSRLTHTRLNKFDSTTNSSFHNDIQFPLSDSLYVDFTHDAHFALLLPTLNLTSFAEAGPLPTDHIPKHRTYISSELMPFATNMQIQVLTCGVKSADGDQGDDEQGGSNSGEKEDEDEDKKEEEQEESKEDVGEDNESDRLIKRGEGRKVRIILNDGVVPLTGIRGCAEDEEGLCDFDTFVDSLTELMEIGDFDGVCI